jgi:hypothetical protein
MHHYMFETQELPLGARCGYLRAHGARPEFNCKCWAPRSPIDRGFGVGRSISVRGHCPLLNTSLFHLVFAKFSGLDPVSEMALPVSQLGWAFAITHDIACTWVQRQTIQMAPPVLRHVTMSLLQVALASVRNICE